MMRFITHARARPRLFLAALAGLLAIWLAPGSTDLIQRILVGWNVTVWLYLVLIGAEMLSADHIRLKRSAVAQDAGAATVLAMVLVGVFVSLAGIVIELSAAKVPGASHAFSHILFAIATVTGSWLLVPTMFALTYASLYFRTAHGSGLVFPDVEADFKPDYWDFLYFSFTIAVAAQTADVSISTRAMRRLVLLQSILSFGFNTAILAFTINIAASMF